MWPAAGPALIVKAHDLVLAAVCGCARTLHQACVARLRPGPKTCPDLAFCTSTALDRSGPSSACDGPQTAQDGACRVGGLRELGWSGDVSAAALAAPGTGHWAGWGVRPGGGPSWAPWKTAGGPLRTACPFVCSARTFVTAGLATGRHERDPLDPWPLPPLPRCPKVRRSRGRRGTRGRWRGRATDGRPSSAARRS